MGCSLPCYQGPSRVTGDNSPLTGEDFFDLAERQGFEPWEGYPSTVFKTAAFDHSATSPEVCHYTSSLGRVHLPVGQFPGAALGYRNSAMFGQRKTMNYQGYSSCCFLS